MIDYSQIIRAADEILFQIDIGHYTSEAAELCLHGMIVMLAYDSSDDAARGTAYLQKQKRLLIEGRNL